MYLNEHKASLGRLSGPPPYTSYYIHISVMYIPRIDNLVYSPVEVSMVRTDQMDKTHVGLISIRSAVLSVDERGLFSGCIA